MNNSKIFRYHELGVQNRSAFHLCGKTGDNFPPDVTVRMEKTVVSLWNQMERFFPLVILGNKTAYLNKEHGTRGGDRGKWFSNIPVIDFGKNGKRGLRLKLFLFFPKNFQWEGLFHLLSHQNDRFIHTNGKRSRSSLRFIC